MTEPPVANALKQLATTMSALARGITNIALKRYEAGTTALKEGDSAPEFELPGSDGQTYRLADMLGRGPVVLAWFPKAFTGG